MRRRTRRRALLGHVLELVTSRPVAVHEIADRLGLEPPAVEGALRELADFDLVVSAPGADGVVRWRRQVVAETPRCEGEGHKGTSCG